MTDRERSFTVVTKTVRLRKGIAEALTDMIYEHQHKFGRLPEGLLVGPNEWLELERYTRALQRWPDAEPSNKAVRKFHGMPVYPKMRPGLDLIPSEGLVPYLTKGIAAKESDE